MSPWDSHVQVAVVLNRVLQVSIAIVLFVVLLVAAAGFAKFRSDQMNDREASAEGRQASGAGPALHAC